MGRGSRGEREREKIVAAYRLAGRAEGSQDKAGARWLRTRQDGADVENQYYAAASTGHDSVRAPRESSGSGLRTRRKSALLSFADHYDSTRSTRNLPGHKFRQDSSKSSIRLSRHSSQQRSEFRKKLAKIFSDGTSTPVAEQAHDEIFGIGRPRTMQPDQAQSLSDLDGMRSKRQSPRGSDQIVEIGRVDQTGRLPSAKLMPSEDDLTAKDREDEVNWPNNLKPLIRQSDSPRRSLEEADV